MTVLATLPVICRGGHALGGANLCQKHCDRWSPNFVAEIAACILVWSTACGQILLVVQDAF